MKAQEVAGLVLALIGMGTIIGGFWVANIHLGWKLGVSGIIVIIMGVATATNAPR